MAEMSSADRGRSAVRRPQQRSRIKNGTSLLPSRDGRSAWARLVRDTLGALTMDCGGDGMILETQRLSARRVSFLEAELVALEDKFARARAEGRAPEANDVEHYGRLADRQRRHCEALSFGAKPPEGTVVVDEGSARNLARAMLAILREAKTEGDETLVPRMPRKGKTLVEVDSHLAGIVGEPAPTLGEYLDATAPAKGLAVGETEVFSNGASVRYEDRSDGLARPELRYVVRDGYDHIHRICADRAVAFAAAAALPKSGGGG